MEPEQRPIPAGTLDSVIGIEGYEVDAEGIGRARMAVVDAVRQPYGIVHGGAYATLAESICSRATYESVGPESIAMGQSNDTTFLRPLAEGVVHALATPRHRGRTSWVWDVEMSDAGGRLCAISRMIIAVRPAERPQ